ncbi:hypothetical protein LDG_8041 [Legionella drancourtii LLAP12]|uniref:Uncharacterized protein n=1 Tax=Legionella drancourtii LLAP12 TaxID=658187 RepID=G9ERX2_9GAMM|nr:hypothetical protein LDG_8041 [Legionella drancourtii LLAP12]
MKQINRITSVLLSIVVQLFFIGFVFLGFLLDPLIGLWIVAFYFFVIGSFLIYYFILNKFSLKSPKKV